MNFIDEALLEARAGNGGAGCASFRREKFIPRGGPDGGDGGKGGDIIFKVDPNLNTLVNFRNIKYLIADNGGSGAGKKRTGQDAKNLIVKGFRKGRQYVMDTPPKDLMNWLH